MITINNIQIGLRSTEETLYNNYAVYLITFEHDDKSLIRHTIEPSVYEDLTEFIGSVLSKDVSPSDYSIRWAILNSDLLTVQVLDSGLTSEREVLNCKYDAISDFKTFAPFGYNDLSSARKTTEISFARSVMCDFLRGMPQSVKHPEYIIDSSFKRRGRKPRPVHCYDRETGKYVASYSSTLEAVRATNATPSGICLCIRGNMRSSGSYIWSYEKVDKLDDGDPRIIHRLTAGDLQKRYGSYEKMMQKQNERKEHSEEPVGHNS